MEFHMELCNKIQISKIIVVAVTTIAYTTISQINMVRHSKNAYILLSHNKKGNCLPNGPCSNIRKQDPCHKLRILNLIRDKLKRKIYTRHFNSNKRIVHDYRYLKRCYVALHPCVRMKHRYILTMPPKRHKNI